MFFYFLVFTSSLAVSTVKRSVYASVITEPEMILNSSSSCAADTTPCGGPSPACCPSGHVCSFNMGIPTCEIPGEPFVSGFGGLSCTDPYFFDCSYVVRLPGHCCPIGTSCARYLDTDVVSCIDAHGTTVTSFPTGTTGLIPAPSTIAVDDPNIILLPLEAWNQSNVVPSCSSSSTLRISSTINSSISYNYTGSSIMIKTVTSPQGGMFVVLVDGFNTTNVIDTYSTGTDKDFDPPTCLSVQFPPFDETPPDFELRNQHSIELLYIGSASQAPNGSTTQSNIQFDTFAAPILFSSSDKVSIGAKTCSILALSLVLVVLIG
ncbi:hypothetical protein C8J56DRAFT_939214 [Mycena floridula]|nr:hypothetical protein C8J56DRAFT_939214 [Mycena floridula]